MAHRIGIIGSGRPGKLPALQEARTKRYDTEYNQEARSLSFLLPSSIDGPPSPSTCQTLSSLDLVMGAEQQQIQRPQLSAVSQSFTPTQTRPFTPTVSIQSPSLQQELMDSIKYLTESLENCQLSLRLKTGENVKLRKYINTLHDAIGEPTCPPDNYFSGEFGMLWRSVHNFGKCFYKFPTEMNVPVDLGDTMRDILGDEETVYRMVSDAKTKLLVVAGILARFLGAYVFSGSFFEKILKGSSIYGEDLAMHALRGYCNGQKGVVSEVDEAIEKNTAMISNDIHEFLIPLMSRPGDQKHMEESFRLLTAFIEHASRIWIKITSLGCDNWRFIFPPPGTPFRSAFMVPCDSCNLGLYGEQSKQYHTLEQTSRKIAFCVLPTVENFVCDEEGYGVWVVIVKAYVLLD